MQVMHTNNFITNKLQLGNKLIYLFLYLFSCYIFTTAVYSACHKMSVESNIEKYQTNWNLLCNPHEMGDSSVHRIIGCIFLPSFKALWSPLLSSNTTYATLKPCKIYTVWIYRNIL